MASSASLETFYQFKTYEYLKEKKLWQTKFDPNDYKRPIKLKTDLINSRDGKKILKKGSKINFIIAKKLHEDWVKNISFTSDYFLGK